MSIEIEKDSRPMATAVGSTDGLADAVRYEIAVAEKQIELLQLRMKEDPKCANLIRPFGSNIWQMKRRLEKALASANNKRSDPAT